MQPKSLTSQEDSTVPKATTSVSPAAHWTRKSLLAFLTLSTGCAPQTYRYANHILIPPNVKHADLKQRTVKLPINAQCAVSEAGIQFTPAHEIKVTIQPAKLIAHPAGWLQQWGEKLEENGCLTAGAGQFLTARILEIVPLDPAAAANLVRSPLLAYRDLTPDYRLFSVGPILRDNAKPGAPAIVSTEGTGASLTITAKASADLIGVETAWYAIRRNHHSDGSRISFVSAEDRIGDQVTHPDTPRLDYLNFSDSAAYYRFFLHTADSASNHLAIVLAAPTQEELRRQTRRLESDPGVCAAAAGLCIEAPFGVALSPALVATVNGVELGIRDRWTIRGALQAVGVLQPESTLPTLQVKRSHNGRMVPVTFDRTRKDILDLPLSGREELHFDARRASAALHLGTGSSFATFAFFARNILAVLSSGTCTSTNISLAKNAKVAKKKELEASGREENSLPSNLREKTLAIP